MKLYWTKYHLRITLLAAIMYIPFLGNVHLFDWDEINFAESAREMIVSNDYLTVQVDFKPFWQKPPLFIWFQVFSMKLFGINEFAARFPNAICGIITLLALFNIGRRWKNEQFGMLWALAYGASILPFLYFKSGIIDPWFNLFIFLGIHQIIEYLNHKKTKNALLSGLYVGLAVLTKGPVGLLLFGLTAACYLVYKKFKIYLTVKDTLVFMGALIFTGGFWFILQILNGNWHIIIEFIEYQIKLFQTKDAGHGGFLLYHFVVVFLGMLPSSLFALPALFKKPSSELNKYEYAFWMKASLWTTLILFTIVKTKIVHYSSMTYFPVSFLAALTLYGWVNDQVKLNRILSSVGMILATVYGITVMVLAYLFNNIPLLLESINIKDKFTLHSLNADVSWTGWELMIGLIPLSLWLLIFLKRSNLFKAHFIYVTTAFFTLGFLLIFVKKIEGYSQRALIEFFEEKQDQDVYLRMVNTKSYASYFYGHSKKHNNEKYYDIFWLLNGDLDKTAYFATKIKHKEKMLKRAPSAEFLGEKNGYLFYRRVPKDDQQ